MTRQYPDQDTPARFLARVASAARAASFKSAGRQLVRSIAAGRIPAWEGRFIPYPL